MYTPYHFIWFPALVFQRNTIIPTSQRAKENVEKSGPLDHRGILHITIIGS